MVFGDPDFHVPKGFTSVGSIATSARKIINLVRTELKVLQDSSSRKGIIIQKADKGKSVAILNKRDYIKRITEMSSDINKFKNWMSDVGRNLIYY